MTHKDNCVIEWWKILSWEFPQWLCNEIIHNPPVPDREIVDLFEFSGDTLISAIIMILAVSLFGITVVEFLYNKIQLIVNPICIRIENRYYKVKWIESAYIRY